MLRVYSLMRIRRLVPSTAGHQVLAAALDEVPQHKLALGGMAKLASGTRRLL